MQRMSRNGRYRSGTVNSNTVNSNFHLIRSYCEIFFYHFPNISCLKCTVNSKFHLIRSKTLLTNDFELTVPNLYHLFYHQFFLFSECVICLYIRAQVVGLIFGHDDKGKSGQSSSSHSLHVASCIVITCVHARHSCCYTLKEHQMVRTFAIFQRILITMDVYEISIFFPSK